MRVYSTLVCSISATALMWSSAVVAQTAGTASPVGDPAEVGDIVVTATKSGEQKLQKVPLAITAFSSAAIAQRGAVSLADIASFTPGFTYSFNGVWSVASLRGIGTNNVFAGGDPSTTLQVDGVYYARPTAANLDFLDIERVEVLRGPQGTLYGRNAIGGTVNVITRDPTNEFHGQARLTLGDYNLVRPEFALSGPIVDDKVSFSLSGRFSSRDGYIKELNPSLPDGWNENRYAARGKLKFSPTDSFTLVLAADYTHSGEYLNAFTIRNSPLLVPDGTNPEFFQSALSNPNRGDTTQWGTSARTTLELGRSTLTSITAYRESNTSLQADLDFSEAPLFHTRAFVERQKQFSQEFDLTGKLGRANYVVGLFGSRERANSFFNATVFGTLLTQGIDALTRSYAAFGQVDYPIFDRLKVTAGLRYTIDRKSAANIFGAQVGGVTNDLAQQPVGTGQIFSGHNTQRAFTPKLGIEFQATQDLLAYASITRGFKSGGYNLLIDPGSIGAAEYGPEHVWAYETGLKVTVPSIRGHFNLAGFYYDYTGLQVNQFEFLANSVAQLVNNAKAADIKGVEAELALQPTPTVDVGGTLAYLDAHYVGFFPAINNFNGAVTDPSGKRLNDAPRLSGSGYVQINRPFGNLDVHLRGDAIYKSKVFYTPLNDIRLGSAAYWLFNVNLALSPRKSGLETGIRLQNITNRKYFIATYYAFSAGGEPGEPRTVRGYVSYKF